MSFDVDRIRSCFPSLDAGAAHFDGPGGTQTPRIVCEAITAFLSGPVANRGTTTLAEQRAECAVTCARQAMADLLGADAAGIVFGRSMTALTFDFARTLSQGWRPGDEIVHAPLTSTRFCGVNLIAPTGCLPPRPRRQRAPMGAHPNP